LRTGWVVRNLTIPTEARAIEVDKKAERIFLEIASLYSFASEYSKNTTTGIDLAASPVELNLRQKDL